jgi:hypothetical protein
MVNVLLDPHPCIGRLQQHDVIPQLLFSTNMIIDVGGHQRDHENNLLAKKVHQVVKDLQEKNMDSDCNGHW